MISCTKHLQEIAPTIIDHLEFLHGRLWEMNKSADRSILRIWFITGMMMISKYTLHVLYSTREDEEKKIRSLYDTWNGFKRTQQDEERRTCWKYSFVLNLCWNKLQRNLCNKSVLLPSHCWNHDGDERVQLSSSVQTSCFHLLHLSADRFLKIPPPQPTPPHPFKDSNLTHLTRANELLREHLNILLSIRLGKHRHGDHLGKVFNKHTARASGMYGKT